MLAVIETGGKQYTVSVGDVLLVEKLLEEEGKNVVFQRVLLTSDGSKTAIGTPFLDTSVEAKVLEHGRGKKIRVFKMKAKKRYQKTQGHRQSFTKVEITKIGASSAKSAPKKVASEKKESAKLVAKKKTPIKKTPAKKTISKKATTQKK